MCCRFFLFADEKELKARFGATGGAIVKPSYNIAPSQPALVVRETSEAGRELAWMQWGLVPFWANDPAIGNKLINARSETATEKPAFRGALKYRRCLLPANGYYEWASTEDKKQPFRIGLRSGEPLAIACLWETWERGEGYLETFAILTTGPNEVVAPLHSRMPVIIDPLDFGRWLDPALRKPLDLKDLCKPYAAELMEALPVSTRVNNPRNDGPSLIEPI